MIKRGSLGLWSLVSGKHATKTLEQVAQVDPDYLSWIWNEKKIYNRLDDTTAYALEDVMKKYGVSFEKKLC